MTWMDFRFVPVFIGMLALSWGMMKVGTAVVRRNPSLREPKIFHLWFLAFCVISLLDVHSTYLMVQRAGIHIEGNPIPFLMLKYFGIVPGLLLRLTVVSAICYFLFRKYPEMLVGLNVFYPFAPIWNYWYVFRAL